MNLLADPFALPALLVGFALIVAVMLALIELGDLIGNDDFKF